jgi:phospholipase/carboxylesterase
VLLLHGYGSNGADLLSLAPLWQQALPETLFLAPNAPQRSGMGHGFQWWGLSAFTPQALAEGTAGAAPAIDAFIDKKLDQYSLGEADLAIVGFSQGTMMALHGTAQLSDQIVSKPPVLLVHGSADPVVPVAALYAAEQELKKLGVGVTSHVSSGLGHSVDPAGLKLGGDFVVKGLGRNSQLI